MLSRRINRLWKHKGKKFNNFRRSDNRKESSGHRRSAKKEVVCYECKEPGHYKNDCPKLQKEKPKKKFNKKKKVLMATWDDSDECESSSESEEECANVALMASTEDQEEGTSGYESESESDDDAEEMFLAARSGHQSWYLDSGCSRHMTGEKSMFQSLELRSGGDVKFGGNQKGKITGSGTIGNGNLPSISNVLLVEGLTHNLLSISQLSDNGYDIIFNQKCCKVVSQKDVSILFNGKRKNNIYKINLSELKVQNVKCLMSVNDEQWAWHRRLGHINMRRISQINKLNLVRGLP